MIYLLKSTLKLWRLHCAMFCSNVLFRVLSQVLFCVLSQVLFCVLSQGLFCVLSQVLFCVLSQVLFLSVFLCVCIVCRKSLKIPKGNQNPYIEEEHTTQWPKVKVQLDKQGSTKHTHKTTDRVTRRVSSSSPLDAPVVFI